jgi:hypothetical protein
MLKSRNGGENGNEKEKSCLSHHSPQFLSWLAA